MSKGKPTGQVSDWVPVDACTIPSAEQPLRVAEFHDLFSTALRAVERRKPGWLRLRLVADPRVEVITRDLLERESECCAFFDFELASTTRELTLDIRVPPGREDVLQGLGRQAEDAAGRSTGLSP